jgi:rsbT antagonist protein RsbS
MARVVPIIQLFRCLIVPVQIELSDRIVGDLKEQIAQEIRRRDVDGLVIEVSGIDVFDSHIVRSVRDIASVAKLMGVQTVLAGLDPAMAMTLVEMNRPKP